MVLFFFAAIPGIINTVIIERWPLSTYLWHFVLLFQCKKCATSPHITYLAVGGKPGVFVVTVRNVVITTKGVLI